MTGQEDRPQVLRPTDDEARKLARILLRSARSAALAVFEPESGAPFASRTLTGTDTDGTPVILVSALSTHTGALRRDPRASLLAGEPGRGDPLAHPRLTVLCEAEEVDRSAAGHARIRDRFLRRHPKARLYADFPDFAFFRLRPLRAHLNGGFGKAYVLEGRDLLIGSPARAQLAEMEAGAVAHMNSEHADAAPLYASHYCGEADGTWIIVGLDAAGIDLSAGDRLRRVEFDNELSDVSELRPALVRLLQNARKQQP